MSNHRSGCAAFLVRCMDYRLGKAVAQCIEDFLGGKCDLSSGAGSARKLVDDQTREGVLGDIRIAVEKHGVRRVVLTAHRDCGAYGGSASFASRDEEYERHRRDLEAAREVIAQEFPDVAVELGYFETSDGDNFVFVPVEQKSPALLTV